MWILVAAKSAALYAENLHKQFTDTPLKMNVKELGWLFADKYA